MSSIRQLHTIFSPEAYELKLELDRSGRAFTGTVSITGKLQKAGHDIVLHAKDLEITRANLDGATVTTDKHQNDELILHSPDQLNAGEHTVYIEFKGKITDPMHGLYPGYFKLNGQDQELLATQFESHHAREVFPCIDEPAAKATFDLTLNTEPNIAVISNTPIKTQDLTDSKRQITVFETTPIMSTYLLAWVVGSLDHVQAKTKDGVLVRVYTTPDKIQQTKFALDTSIKTLQFFNDYFGVPYPLKKCDLVALPDFSAGAMENWGCITFRENCLLVDDGHTSTEKKQYVAMVIAHELAHQWFGNLVTMQWWDDLWLNESFATWASYLACDHLFPAWQMWTRFFTDETMLAYQRDGLASVQTVQQEVSDPAEITTLFDAAIVYAKGASLLYMLHSYIGAGIFQKGLSAYLKQFAYGNAVTNDLWQSMSAETNIDIASFMQPWLTKAGHAVVSAHVGAQSTYISQRRFYINPQAALKDNADLWPIPLMSDEVINTELLDAHTVSVDYVKSSTPFLLNRGRGGFYLSNYDPKHLLKLAESVTRRELTVIDRLGLLSDGLFLCQGGYQPTVQLLQLLEAYRSEDSYPVWLIIKDILNDLKMMVEGTPDLELQLQQFISDMVRPQYTRLGWRAVQNEAYE
ncbi:MAG TPA: M1 family metallopeptidase, partial [Patescibacteria group bacterium]|nr:M1 family metallopeptidase [Patescibacteria group bacterium]